MKKFRGKARYYRNLKKEEIPVWLDIRSHEKNWFDFFHQHIFTKDIGIVSWKSRKQHLDCLFRLAEKYEKEVKYLNRDFQLWININEFDYEDDAIYLHTENPNNSEFPWRINDQPEKEATNRNLDHYLRQKESKYIILKFIVKDQNEKESINYCLQRPNIGISLK